MTTLREEFHALGNWLNKISMASIIVKESLTDDDLTQLSPEQAKAIIAKATEILEKVSGYVEGADKVLVGMKPFIYAKIGPTTEFEPAQKDKKV